MYIYIYDITENATFPFHLQQGPLVTWIRAEVKIPVKPTSSRVNASRVVGEAQESELETCRVEMVESAGFGDRKLFKEIEVEKKINIYYIWT